MNRLGFMTSNLTHDKRGLNFLDKNISNPQNVAVPAVQSQEYSIKHADISSLIAFKGIKLENGQPKVISRIEERFSFNNVMRMISSFGSGEKESLRNFLVKTCKPHNMLGEGKTHAVFAIPGHDDFVLRVNKYNDICMGPIFLNSRILFPKVNLGQPVANIGIDLQVLRKVQGKSQGTPYVLLQQARKVVANSSAKLPGQEEYVANIVEISSVPQSAFDSFAKKVNFLRKNGYVYDIANPNNILYHSDPAQNICQFNIVDDLYDEKQMMKMYGGNAWKGTLEDVLNPFMDISAANLYLNEGKDLRRDPEIKKIVMLANRIIFSKCISACAKADIPLEKNKLNMDIISSLTGMEEGGIKAIFDNWTEVKKSFKEMPSG